MNEMKAYQCLKFMIGCCDGARTEDGIGFNRADGGFARSLHEQLMRKGGFSGSLSEKQLASLVRMLSLYKGQLAGLVDKEEDWTFFDPEFSQAKAVAAAAPVGPFYRSCVTNNRVVFTCQRKGTNVEFEASLSFFKGVSARYKSYPNIVGPEKATWSIAVVDLMRCPAWRLQLPTCIEVSDSVAAVVNREDAPVRFRPISEGSRPYQIEAILELRR